MAITFREFIDLSKSFGVRVAETRSATPRRFLIRLTEFGNFIAVPDHWDEHALLPPGEVSALCLDLGIVPRDFDEGLDRLT